MSTNSDEPQKTLKDSYWLAERLGISYQKARIMGSNNEVPNIRIGRLIRYSEESIDEYLKEITHRVQKN